MPFGRRPSTQPHLPGGSSASRPLLVLIAGLVTIVLAVVGVVQLREVAGSPDGPGSAGSDYAAPGGVAASSPPAALTSTPTTSAKPTAKAKAKATTPTAQRYQGWPGPDDTGVPSGVTLTTYTGPLTITKANTVIDKKAINGCLIIKAANVVIKRSRLRCSDWMIEIMPGGHVTVEDSELDGQRTAFVIGPGDYTFRRVEIHNMNEGPRVGDNVLIEDSWIHAMVLTNPDDHQDILQTCGGVNSVIRHNTLDATVAGRHHNAVFQLGSEISPLLDKFLIEGNLMSGGGFSVNFRNDPGMRSVVFRDNTFVPGTTQYDGAVIGQNIPAVTWASSNVWLDSGKPVI